VCFSSKPWRAAFRRCSPGLPEVVEKTGGRLLVEPDDPGRLPMAARLADRTLRETLGERAFNGVRALQLAHSTDRSMDVCRHCQARAQSAWWPDMARRDSGLGLGD
jgi:hypothetical protein